MRSDSRFQALSYSACFETRLAILWVWLKWMETALAFRENCYLALVHNACAGGTQCMWYPLFLQADDLHVDDFVASTTTDIALLHSIGLYSHEEYVAILTRAD